MHTLRVVPMTLLGADKSYRTSKQCPNTGCRLVSRFLLGTRKEEVARSACALAVPMTTSDPGNEGKGIVGSTARYSSNSTNSIFSSSRCAHGDWLQV